METFVLIIKLVIGMAAFMPPDAPAETSPIEQLRDRGMTLYGHDPFLGTELHGPSLPVHSAEDVTSLVIHRRGFTPDNLRLLREFPKLKTVRCERPLTLDEYKRLCEALPENTNVASHLRLEDGSVHTIYNRPGMFRNYKSK